ncbi:hypothetical protein DSOL_4058 [Desulfosporosinus metallidurans]|uniref:Uncharacterized protein n=1 Tax=Desulfosporosinus metallidurans TaxID=1888891 RepID=A0A1Q8QM47_9FIRM|nr:hypothetical protein DSOL_4058 [Desulfosporosinus metallidurans]
MSKPFHDLFQSAPQGTTAAAATLLIFGLRSSFKHHSYLFTNDLADLWTDFLEA